MGKRTLGRCLCTFSGNVRVIGFDSPGVQGIGRDYIVVSYTAPICSSIGYRSIRTGGNGFVCNFWCRVNLYSKIKGSSRARSADWGKGVDDGLLRIGDIA